MTFLSKYRLQVACSVIVLCFIISRLPFFLYFPIPGGFSPDCFEYFMVARDVESGGVPIFDIRTPGYPVFLSLINIVFGTVMAVVVVQTLLTLAATLFLTYAVSKTYRRLTYPVMIAMVFYFMGNNSLEADSNLLPNSLYANMLIAFLGLFILALNRNKYWVLLSVLVGSIIYVRPSGLFLVPIIGVILIFLLLQSRYRGAWLKLTAPAGLMLLALSFYNWSTLDKFSLSPWGAMNLLGVVVTFLEPDPSYTECENKIIAKTHGDVPQHHLETLASGFNLSQRYHIYFENYYGYITFYRALLSDCGYSNYVEAVPVIKKICYDTIKKKPQEYVKFFATNFYYYVIGGALSEHRLFYYSEVEMRYKNIYILKKPQKPQYFNVYLPLLIPDDVMRFSYKEFYGATDSSTYEQRYARLKANFLFRIFDTYTLKINRVLLRNWFWAIALIILFLWSGIQLLLSRISDKEALLIFVICCFNICSAILVSLVEISFYHYTYLTEFTYFLAVALSPVLVKKWISV